MRSIGERSLAAAKSVVELAFPVCQPSAGQHAVAQDKTPPLFLGGKSGLDLAGKPGSLWGVAWVKFSRWHCEQVMQHCGATAVFHLIAQPGEIFDIAALDVRNVKYEITALIVGCRDKPVSVCCQHQV